jgi:hypothetical protein
LSVVTARDGDVLWRFVCERDVWRLEAAPSSAPSESFDTDLLARQFLGRGLANATVSRTESIQASVEELVKELQVIRRFVVEAFRPESWPAAQTALMRTGRQRDFELFGRPLPPGAA